MSNQPYGQYPQQTPYPQQQQYGYPGTWQQPLGYAAPVKNSGLGLASLLIGIFVGVMEFILIIAAGVMEVQGGPNGMDENSPQAVILGLLLLGGMGLALLGLVLGIVGLTQKQTAKTFAVMGMIFNGLVLLGVLGLMVVGLAMG